MYNITLYDEDESFAIRQSINNKRKQFDQSIFSLILQIPVSFVHITMSIRY